MTTLEDGVAPFSALSQPAKPHGLVQAGSRVIHKLAHIDEPSAMEARQCVVNELFSVLDADRAGVLRDLAALRTGLSHRPHATVTEEAARNYAEAASRAAGFLRLIAVIGPEFGGADVWGPPTDSLARGSAAK